MGAADGGKYAEVLLLLPLVVLWRGEEISWKTNCGLRIVTGRSLGSVAAFIQKVEQIGCGQGGTQGMENACHFAVC